MPKIPRPLAAAVLAAPLAAGPALGGEIDIEAGRQFWAFQPLAESRPGPADDPAWANGMPDAYLAAEHAARALSPAPDAGSLAYARRLTYDLTGLPPTPEEASAFAESERAGDPDARRRLADRLLASPRFGEKWGRAWLDLARYADSNGGDINFTFHNAWRYRDYAVAAFNADKPFDQFLREQIAGDLLPWESEAQRAEQLIAAGFLMVGSKMLSERDKEKMDLDVADEQIDTVGRVFLGQTLGCARCHDHKFDPVSMADYYALAGIFYSTRTAEGIRMGNVNVSGWIERDLPMVAAGLGDEAAAAVAKAEETLAKLKSELPAAKNELKKLTAKAEVKRLGVVIDDAEAEKVGAWKTSTHRPVFHGKGYLHNDKQGQGEWSVTFTAMLPASGEYEVRFAYANGGEAVDRGVPIAIEHAGGTAEVALDQEPKPGDLFKPLGRFQFDAAKPAKLTVLTGGTTGFVLVDGVQFIAVEDIPKEAAGGNAGAAEQIAALKESVKAMEKAKKDAEAALERRPLAMAPADRDEPGDQPIRVRGEPHQLGDEVPRGFLQVLYDGEGPCMIAEGESGRRELVDWLASDARHLVARVTANRIWAGLFRDGIVRSVDNFGTLGEPPTHPALLDSLAADFIASGWSQKRMIRSLVNSRAYGMAVDPPPGASQPDPENRWLSHQNRRRLAAEEIRDSLLAAADSLDHATPGSPVAGLGEQAIANDAAQKGGISSDDRLCRSLYLPMVRSDMLPFLEIFNAANPDVATGQRPETTVPAQALYLMNADFAKNAAAQIAARASAEISADPANAIYRLVLGRPASDAEREDAQAFARSHPDGEKAGWAALARAVFASTEFQFLE